MALAIIAAARRLQAPIEVVRNGSRGLFELETLVEVETSAGRSGYGPIYADDVSSLIEANFLEGAPHPKRVGRPEAIPFFRRQTRLTTPCRSGSVRGLEALDRVIAQENPGANLAVLNDLCETMKSGSLCALGGLTPYPVLSALKHFGGDFRATRRDTAESGRDR